MNECVIDLRVAREGLLVSSALVLMNKGGEISTESLRVLTSLGASKGEKEQG